MRDRGIGSEGAVDVVGSNRGILRVFDRRQPTAEGSADAGDSLAVRSVLRDQNVSAARNQRADRRLDREGAAALKRNALVSARAADDLKETFTDASGDAVEVHIPRPPVKQHGLPGTQ